MHVAFNVMYNYMENFDKYVKYKKKYMNIKTTIEQTGGKRTTTNKTKNKRDENKQNEDKRDEDKRDEDKPDIVEFIKRSNIEDIKNNLINLIYNKRYCPDVLGQGNVGRAFVPKIGPKETVKIGKSSASLPIVIKESLGSGEFTLEIIDSILYVYGIDNMTAEAIILSYVNKLWYEKKSPHLPLMIGYSCCGIRNNLKTKNVDTIATEKHGLDEKVGMDLGYLYPYALQIHDESRTEVFSSTINTFSSLFKYVLSQNSEEVMLPNGIKCNFAELCDYICIGYIHTFNLLMKHNIYVLDMHTDNIFIHWLGENSYMGDVQMVDVESIVYKINDKMYATKTFGFLIKLGDMGGSIVIPRNDVIILGTASDMINNRALIPAMTKSNFQLNLFFIELQSMVPRFFFEKTVAHNISKCEPYNKISWVNQAYTEKNRAALFSPYQLINFYARYEIKQVPKNKHTLSFAEH